MECGADFILTQLIFDADEFFEFVKKCREANIQIPIIPGILPVHSSESVYHIKDHCEVSVPKEFIDFLEQNNDEQMKFDFSMNYFVNLSKKIIDSKLTSGLHFYTMNNFKIIKSILSRLTNESNESNISDESFSPLGNLKDVHFAFKNFKN